MTFCFGNCSSSLLSSFELLHPPLHRRFVFFSVNNLSFGSKLFPEMFSTPQNLINLIMLLQIKYLHVRCAKTIIATKTRFRNNLQEFFLPREDQQFLSNQQKNYTYLFGNTKSPIKKFFELNGKPKLYQQIYESMCFPRQLQTVPQHQGGQTPLSYEKIIATVVSEQKIPAEWSGQLKHLVKTEISRRDKKQLEILEEQLYSYFLLQFI